MIPLNASIGSQGCDVVCKICRYDMEPLETLRELGFRLVEEGQLLPVHMVLMENLKRESTIIPEKRKVDRGKWAEGLNFVYEGGYIGSWHQYGTPDLNIKYARIAEQTLRKYQGAYW